MFLQLLRREHLTNPKKDLAAYEQWRSRRQKDPNRYPVPSPFPPSIGGLISKYDRDGNLRPPAEVAAEIAAQKRKRKRKKELGYSADSHWSVRKTFYSKEIDGMRRVLQTIVGEREYWSLQARATKGAYVDVPKLCDGALKPDTGALVLAALTTEQRGRGRPSTPPQRKAFMMLTVEAYMGARLKQEAAIDRAADRWRVSVDHMRDLYKENKLPQYEGSELIRATFMDFAAEKIDEAIASFMQTESLLRRITPPAQAH